MTAGTEGTLRTMTVQVAKVDTLAGRINAEHRAATDAASSALKHARDCGRLLIQAKDQIRHGGWTAWIEEHCEFTPRTARLYMQIAGRWREIAKQNGNALPFRDAARLLAAPRLVRRPRAAPTWDGPIQFYPCCGPVCDVPVYPYDDLKRHPARPEMPPGPIDGLVMSIRRRGFIPFPITLLEGKVLDGWCRLQACRRLKVAPAFQRYLGVDDPTAYYIALHVCRRHLNDFQRVRVAASLGFDDDLFRV